MRHKKRRDSSALRLDQIVDLGRLDRAIDWRFLEEWVGRPIVAQKTRALVGD